MERQEVTAAVRVKIWRGDIPYLQNGEGGKTIEESGWTGKGRCGNQTQEKWGQQLTVGVGQEDLIIVANTGARPTVTPTLNEL